MSGRVRVLSDEDLPAARRLLESRPVENVFVTARVRQGGLERFRLGCAMFGFERDGELVSLLHAGSNLVPVNADDSEIVEAFVEWMGPGRTCSSIIGPARVALELWEGLSHRWGTNWARVREVRARQPVMVLDSDPVVRPDPRLRRMTVDDWEPYFHAAVAMYTEEVGVSPVKGNPASYKFYVRQLIEAGRAFGIVENGRVLYKSDLGSVTPAVGQIQGVWLDPALRGRGLAPSCMAGVVALARQQVRTVSLYVNDFNVAARRTYARTGFREQGEFATILY